ncbi:MAG TPA: diaminopimelate decarboxylase [Bacteroidia bacterium]|nr:diaminopimelate decarboxylase [Bacteroidia bacterium]
MLDPNLLTRFRSIETPFYYYDLELLRNTLHELSTHLPERYHVHYALKANANREILKLVMEAGLGADCVSGNEVKRAFECGFKPSKIVFAGVGKSDREIKEALDLDIFCFNAESIQELEVLNQMADNAGKKARVAIRVNPNVDAYTHQYITTGLEENKFGINPYDFEKVLNILRVSDHLHFEGLHFHIGSQITDMTAFKNLCTRVNDINTWFAKQGFLSKHLNLGGGLGIDYRLPDENKIVDFKTYFSIFKTLLEPLPGQELHFELGRSIVAQCGNLVSRVLYIKHGLNTHFVILDAGMTELMRPALYQAYHKIENLSKFNKISDHKYDVVGPICESSDCFGKAVELPLTERGDLIVIRSAGAYGEVMSNRYNLREAAASVYSL